jgi:UDP-N-acetyl-D-mannosaminuronic acid dehydrogenase
VVTNARTAEMAKLTENASRDVSIAFANELSIVCDKLKIDVWELIRLANRHPRVNILQPGPGVGGHCIAVDPWFIVSSAPDEAKLMSTARKVNNSKPKWVVEKVKIAIADFLQSNPQMGIKDVVIACYGLSFKPDIDDLRESPSMSIAQNIAEFHKGKVLVVEPNINELPASLNIELVSFGVAETQANIAVLLVDHQEFRVSGAPDIKIILDTKGIWL